MTRRALSSLMLLAETPDNAPAYPPTDAKKLNEFALCWNEYVRELTEGKVNYKMWRAVISAWAALDR